MSQVVLQTPVPASDSEMLVVGAALIWFFVMLFLARRIDRLSKHCGEVVSFLAFVLGLLLLVVLLT